MLRQDFECRLPVSITAMIAVVASLMALVSCGDRAEPVDAEDRYDEGTFTQADDPIEFTDQPLSVPDDPDGEVVDISTVNAIQDPGDPTNPDPAWYGFAANFPYPQGSTSALNIPCETTFLNRAYEVPSLPAKIRGVVTLVNHYEKISLCGQDHRHYGVYTLQDETGTIMVLKDTRIEDFTYGDTIEIEVIGLAKSFGRLMVIADRNEEVLETDGKVPYQSLDKEFGAKMLGDSLYQELQQAPQVCWDYIGSEGVNKAFGVLPGFNNMYRVQGTVVTEPTNTNFNAMTLERNVGGETRSWTVSFGLELGRRGVDVEQGDRVQVTGPGSGRLIGFAPCEWQFQMLATSIGQVKILD